MDRTRLRLTLVAFILSLAVLSLGPLCFLIECNLRQTVHGQVSFDLHPTVEQGLVTLNQPPSLRLQQAATALLSPPVRVVVTLWRTETQAAARLWERLIPG